LPCPCLCLLYLSAAALVSLLLHPLPVPFVLQQPAEIYVDDEAKLTLHGLVQHYVMLHEEEKNRKLTDLLDALDFNQVCGQTMISQTMNRSWRQPFCSPVAAWCASQPEFVSMMYADAKYMSCLLHLMCYCGENAFYFCALLRLLHHLCL
jgi:hypothetical protein